MPDQSLATHHHVRAELILVAVGTSRLVRLATLLDDGALQATVGETLPLSAARTAHEMLLGCFRKDRIAAHDVSGPCPIVRPARESHWECRELAGREARMDSICAECLAQKRFDNPGLAAHGVTAEALAPSAIMLDVECRVAAIDGPQDQRKTRVCQKTAVVLAVSYRFLRLSWRMPDERSAVAGDPLCIARSAKDFPLVIAKAADPMRDAV